MSLPKKINIILLVSFLVVFLDRMTKVLAANKLKSDSPVTCIFDLLTLSYSENSGAMLSLGSQLSEELRFYIFTVTVGVGLAAGLVYIILRAMSAQNLIFASLILSGGLANLYDRAFNHGLVVDFAVLKLGPFSTGVFNVADVAILFGALGLMLSTQQRKHVSMS